MKNFDANACMDAFCALCEELVLNELVGVDEAQYWVFEQGYQSANASIAAFSKLCDKADSSDLLSAIDCQYWLFERGHLAAEFEQLDLVPFAKASQNLAKLNLN